DAAPRELVAHTVRLAGLLAAAGPGAEAVPVLALVDAALRPTVVGVKGVAVGLVLTALGVGGALGMGQPGAANWAAAPPVGPKAVAAAPAPLRTDRYGDPLPDDAIARLGTVRLRHAAPIRAVAITPDGKLIASTSNDNTVRVWDTASGRELHRWRGEDRVGA